MALLDHRKTWRFEVAGSPETCVAAFLRAFSSKGSVWKGAKWKTETKRDGALATYQGRKGVAGVIAGMAATSQREEQNAKGSEVRFLIEETTGEKVVCALWLVKRAKMVGVTADARFIRPYFGAVERELRLVDPALSTDKV